MRNLLFHKYYGRILILLFAGLFLISPENSLNQWEKIQERGYLTWVTRPSPLTYYNSLDGIIGLEYDILNRFCAENNLELKVVVAPSNNNLFDLFDGYNIDIAGANLTHTNEREDKYIASLEYDSTSILLVSSFRKPKIKSLNILKDYAGVVINSSSYVAITKDLIEKYEANIAVKNDINLYELLQMVTEGTFDYTLADENIIAIYGSYIPKLRIGQKLSESHKLVFYMRNKLDLSFKEKLDKFIGDYKLQNRVQRYKEFLVKSLPNSKPADTVNFLKNYKNRWPKIKPYIYQVANELNINPVFLGAISYQESHWNPKAISPTLVKGLMMLTKDVAKEQGVTDRFDPLQSLRGGVKHFFKMKRMVPERIQEPDKTSFALAAYNLGYGNLEKARIITQRAGQSPDLWEDVKLFLPLLNDIKDRKIDGKTAVRYVENIYVYQNLLQWKEQQFK